MQMLEMINGFVWGIPALFLILGSGIYLSVRTGFAQIRFFPKAIKTIFSGFRKKNKNQGISAYRAMCTALAATVGTGNLAGVAGAIAIGGPGSIFWMWICAALGMIIKFAEATLAIKYRKRDSAGHWFGGPMYIIERGLGQKWKWLATAYCCFGIVASFGVGNATQINTLLSSVQALMESNGLITDLGTKLIFGILLAALIGTMLRGGAQRIGAVAEMLVPFASVIYIILAIGVLILRYEYISQAFSLILQGAFSPEAVTAGVIGSAFAGLRIGASRGVFSNEAGMGTAAIAHSCAEVDHPVEQGFMGIIEVFLDTIVICTLTALVILSSGIQIPYGIDTGFRLTGMAFAQVYGDWVYYPITVILCLFAFATILGWGLYGGRCVQYIFGEYSWNTFVKMQAMMVVVGAVLQTGTVWLMADIVNGLMVIPNLFAIFLLTPELVILIHDFQRKRPQTK